MAPGSGKTGGLLRWSKDCSMRLSSVACWCPSGLTPHCSTASGSVSRCPSPCSLCLAEAAPKAWTAAREAPPGSSRPRSAVFTPRKTRGSSSSMRNTTQLHQAGRFRYSARISRVARTQCSCAKCLSARRTRVRKRREWRTILGLRNGPGVAATRVPLIDVSRPSARDASPRPLREAMRRH